MTGYIEATITEHEELLRLARLKSDIDELTILIDDGIIFSAMDGGIVGKEDDLNLHKPPDFRITKLDVIERKIKSFDSSVVVSTLIDASALFRTNEQNDKIRYICVWHKFPEGWRIISGSMRAEAS